MTRSGRRKPLDKVARLLEDRLGPAELLVLDGLEIVRPAPLPPARAAQDFFASHRPSTFRAGQFARPGGVGRDEALAARQQGVAHFVDQVVIVDAFRVRLVESTDLPLGGVRPRSLLPLANRARVDGKKLLKILREEYNTVLAGGQQKLDGKIFRIGHLGYVSESDINITIESIKAALPKASSS